MFEPTHLLVSKTKEIPVRLVSSPKGYFAITETEWQQDREPAFEVHPKLGFFCRGIQVLGYRLKPINIDAETASPEAAAPVPQSA